MNWRKTFFLLGLMAMGTFTLSACDSGGSDPVDVVEAPGTPTGVTAMADGTSITVSFTPGQWYKYLR